MASISERENREIEAAKASVIMRLRTRPRDGGKVRISVWNSRKVLLKSRGGGGNLGVAELVGSSAA